MDQLKQPRVDRRRIYAGWLCIALAFAFVIGLGLGVVEPTGSGAAQAGTLAALLAGLVPMLLGVALVFAIGLWLLKGPRKP